jgi:peroxiredoxin
VGDLSVLAIGSRAPRAELPSAFGAGTVAVPGEGPTILGFFKASCPTCQWVLPWIERYHLAASHVGLRVVGVAEDEPDAARELATAHGVTFPFGVEPAPWALSESYGLASVPTFFLVDEVGVVRMTSVGFARDDLVQALERAAEVRGVSAPRPFPDDLPAFRPG